MLYRWTQQTAQMNSGLKMPARGGKHHLQPHPNILPEAHSPSPPSPGPTFEMGGSRPAPRPSMLRPGAWPRQALDQAQVCRSIPNLPGAWFNPQQLETPLPFVGFPPSRTTGALLIIPASPPKTWAAWAPQPRRSSRDDDKASLSHIMPRPCGWGGGTAISRSSSFDPSQQKPSPKARITMQSAVLRCKVVRGCGAAAPARLGRKEPHRTCQHSSPRPSCPTSWLTVVFSNSNQALEGYANTADPSTDKECQFSNLTNVPAVSQRLGRQQPGSGWCARAGAKMMCNASSFG
jgi:hypothetical protein